MDIYSIIQNSGRLSAKWLGIKHWNKASAQSIRIKLKNKAITAVLPDCALSYGFAVWAVVVVCCGKLNYNKSIEYNINKSGIFGMGLGTKHRQKALEQITGTQHGSCSTNWNKAQAFWQSG